MKTTPASWLVACCATAGAIAMATPAVAQTAVASTVAEAGEPRVQRTVIEDDSVRIEELRVRGQLQRIVVAPKGRAPSYEIITGDPSRDLSDGASTSRGAAGKRVWNLFRF